MELLNPILGMLESVPDPLKAVLMIVGAASILASYTPNKHDDKIVGFLFRLLNTTGFNFGNAKNQD